MPDSRSIASFDRKFVVAATAIGVVYSLIVVGVSKLIGKEAAGVAGVALAALATGIFQKFEGLRFKTPPSRTIEIPTLNVWIFILLVFAFSGSEVLFSVIVAIFAYVFGQSPGSGANLGDFLSALLNPYILMSLVGAKALSYFATAYCSGRVIANMKYSQIMIAGLCALICSIFLPLLVPLIENPSAVKYLLSQNWVAGVFSIGFLVAVLLGAMLADRHSSNPNPTFQPSRRRRSRRSASSA